MRAPFAFGFFVARDADDQLGVIERKIVDPLVEALVGCWWWSCCFPFHCEIAADGVLDARFKAGRKSGIVTSEPKAPCDAELHKVDFFRPRKRAALKGPRALTEAGREREDASSGGWCDRKDQDGVETATLYCAIDSAGQIGKAVPVIEAIRETAQVEESAGGHSESECPWCKSARQFTRCCPSATVVAISRAST